ncbi:MAG: hypothetical protein OEY51_11115, partial [Cyclobacteriaceae bacterium]|nr:hypothetical protein [Cyclobacteriaceae bacterium]
RGTSLFNSSDFIGSYENFEKARGIDPSFAEAHFMSALFWNSQLSLTSMNSGLTNKSYQEMMDLYNERLEQAIKYAEPVEKLKYLGHQAELKLQFRKGLDYMKDYLNKRPNDIHELATAISLAVVLGEKETAVNYVIQMDSAALTNADDIGEVIINYFWVGKYLEGARKAIQAVKDFPYDQHLLYQAHRVLLWNGMVKEAGELLPRLDGWESQALPKVRQACAENDSARAYAIYHAEIEPLKQLDNSVWISLMLFNRKEEATDYIRPLYDRDELYSLSSWLIYPYFDLTPFPKLQAVLDREGSKRPGATGIPFALKARP